MSNEQTQANTPGWARAALDSVEDPNSEFGIRRVGIVIITVQDPQRALRFYRDKLGMQVRSMNPGWVELDGGGVIVALHPLESKRIAKEGDLPAVVFDVDDVYEAYDLLKTRGVKFVTDPRIVHESPCATGIAATFLDTEQNVLSIYATVEKNPRIL